MRQLVDLEHWPAFHASFTDLASLLRSVASGERSDGEAPASVVVLSGDVHHGYLARATFGDGAHNPVYQAVGSPLRNPLGLPERLFMLAGWTRPVERFGRWLARLSGVNESCRRASRRGRAGDHGAPAGDHRRRDRSRSTFGRGGVSDGGASVIAVPPTALVARLYDAGALAVALLGVYLAQWPERPVQAGEAPAWWWIDLVGGVLSALVLLARRRAPVGSALVVFALTVLCTSAGWRVRWRRSPSPCAARG